MTTPNSSPNLKVAAADPAPEPSEEARRLAIRCRELLHYARHVQRSRQRLKEHDEHLAWVNRQVTQKLYRQRVEQAQWAAEQGHRESVLARESERIAQRERELAQREAGLASNGTTAHPVIDHSAVADIERQLAQEREAHLRTQEELEQALARLQDSQTRAVATQTEAHADHDRLAAELAAAKKDVELLREELEVRKREVEESAAALTAAQNDAAQLREQELGAVRQEIEDHQKQAGEALQALAAAQAEVEALRQTAGGAEEADRLRQELEQVRELLAVREQEHASALEKLAELERNQQSAASQQTGQAKALAHEIESLHKLLAERDQAHMEAAASLSELKRAHQNALNSQAQELEALKQAAAQAAQEKDEALQASEQLRAELAAIRQQPAERPAAPPVPPARTTPPPAAVAPAAPPARPSRPQSAARIVLPPENAPTVIAPSPAAAVRPPSRAELRVPFDLSGVEAAIAAFRKDLETDRKALEADLAHGDALKSGQREPSPGTADMAAAQEQFQAARELLKVESENFQKATGGRTIAPPSREKPAADKPVERPLAARRAEVESSPVFELPPLKPSTLTPPEPPPPPAKEQPRQRGTLHGLRKWLGEK